MDRRANLAELIEEGKRLEAMERDATSYSALTDARTLLQDLYIVNGPRLLAVAEAAMDHASEVRQTTQLESESGWYASRAPRLLRDVQKFLAAFDAAASGEARG